MHKKIVIAGGTGFIGRFLTTAYRGLGYDVMVISRRKEHVQWTDQNGLISALEHAEMLINLAGKSVDCRYTPKNKQAILLSRTSTTQALGEALMRCFFPPPLWINSSTATIYRHAEDRPMTETGGDVGTGFSVDVAKSWERSFFDFTLPATRQVALRMAIVLGRDGGVIRPLVRLVRCGLGGRQGNGRQMFSWVHLEDVFRVIQFIQAHPDLHGVYNCAAPHPVTNAKLMETLRQLLSPPLALTSPAWLLRMGAVLIRTETELVLKSRWVLPEKLLEAGFSFRYPTVEFALRNILSHDMQAIPHP